MKMSRAEKNEVLLKTYTTEWCSLEIEKSPLKIIYGIFVACRHNVYHVAGNGFVVYGIVFEVFACADVHALINLSAVATDNFGVESFGQ